MVLTAKRVEALRVLLQNATVFVLASDLTVFSILYARWEDLGQRLVVKSMLNRSYSFFFIHNWRSLKEYYCLNWRSPKDYYKVL